MVRSQTLCFLNVSKDRVTRRLEVDCDDPHFKSLSLSILSSLLFTQFVCVCNQVICRQESFF